MNLFPSIRSVRFFLDAFVPLLSGARGGFCAALLLLLISIINPQSAICNLVISNSTPTNITATNAWLVGDLAATNAAWPALTAFYGTGNGGTNPALWQHSNYYGTAAATGIVSVLATNLAPATWHYYRWCAIEGTNTAWAGTSTNFFTLSRPPTNYPDTATNPVTVMAGTNGLFLAPTREKIIAANSLATGTPVQVESDPVFTSSVAAAISAADTTLWHKAAADGVQATGDVATLQGQVNALAEPTNRWNAATNAVREVEITGGTAIIGTNKLVINVPVPVADGYTTRKSGNTFSVAPWIPKNLLSLRYEVWNLAASYSQGLIDGPGYWFDDENGIMAEMSTNANWADPGYGNVGGETKWETITSLPQSKDGAAAFSLGGDIFVTAGWSGSYLTNCYRLDGGAWTEVNGLLSTGDGFSGASLEYDGLVYLLGGSSDKVQVFDGIDWNYLDADYPVAVSVPSAAMMDGYIYVAAGGVTNFCRYDGDSWESLEDCGTTVDMARMEAVGDALFLMGGAAGGAWGLTNVFVWHNGTWSNGPALPAPRGRGGSAVINNRLLWICGSDAGDSSTSNVWELVDDTWVSLPAPPQASQGFGRVVVGNRVYLFGNRFSEGDAARYLELTVTEAMTLTATNTILPFVPGYSYPSALIHVGENEVSTNEVQIEMSRDLGNTWTRAEIEVRDTWAVSNKLFVGTCWLTNQPVESNTLIRVLCSDAYPLTVLGVAAPCAPAD